MDGRGFGQGAHGAALSRPAPSWSARELREAAVAVLARNHVGGWTKPAPRLYPHQWSWDAAFIAIGLAHHDPDRALREIEHLFGAQWRDGRVPHIVFDPRVPDYWPGPELWASRESSAHAPRDRATSGLIQPPMHAIAVWDIARIARLDRDDANPELLTRVRALYPKLFAWHRYLAEQRDPDGTGMISVYHPWEGTDNTPRWDAALARINVGELPPYVRTDLLEVESAERPTKAEYDRYLWLVAQLRAVGYDDARARRDHPFLIKDVQCSAIFGAANAALEWIAGLIGASDDDRATLARWSARSCAAVQRCWDSELDLALDWDERTGEPIRVLTSAGFCALLVPGLDRDLARRAQACVFGPDFAGAPGLAFPVILSTGRSSAAFRPRAYWRGPAWPVINWLIWRGLLAQDLTEGAARLREANLALLARPSAGFAEYYEPFTGEPLGSPDQSWTAAVTIDWLAWNV